MKLWNMRDWASVRVNNCKQKKLWSQSKVKGKAPGCVGRKMGNRWRWQTKWGVGRQVLIVVSAAGCRIFALSFMPMTKKWYKKVPRALNMDGVMDGKDWPLPSPRGAAQRVSSSHSLGEAGEGSVLPGLYQTFWFWRSPTKPVDGWRERKSSATVPG